MDQTVLPEPYAELARIQKKLSELEQEESKLQRELGDAQKQLEAQEELVKKIYKKNKPVLDKIMKDQNDISVRTRQLLDSIKKL